MFSLSKVFFSVCVISSGSELRVEEQRFSLFRFQSFSEVVFLIEDISYLYFFVKTFLIFYLFTGFLCTKPPS